MLINEKVFSFSQYRKLLVIVVIVNWLSSFFTLVNNGLMVVDQRGRLETKNDAWHYIPSHIVSYSIVFLIPFYSKTISF